jgi:hypothetical protein
VELRRRRRHDRRSDGPRRDRRNGTGHRRRDAAQRRDAGGSSGSLGRSPHQRTSSRREPCDGGFAQAQDQAFSQGRSRLAPAVRRRGSRPRRRTRRPDKWPCPARAAPAPRPRTACRCRRACSSPESVCPEVL